MADEQRAQQLTQQYKEEVAALGPMQAQGITANQVSVTFEPGSILANTIIGPFPQNVSQAAANAAVADALAGGPFSSQFRALFAVSAIQLNSPPRAVVVVAPSSSPPPPTQAAATGTSPNTPPSSGAAGVYDGATTSRDGSGSGGLSAGAAAGIAIVCTLAAVVVALGLYALILRRRRANVKPEEVEPEEEVEKRPAAEEEAAAGGEDDLAAAAAGGEPDSSGSAAIASDNPARASRPSPPTPSDIRSAILARHLSQLEPETVPVPNRTDSTRQLPLLLDAPARSGSFRALLGLSSMSFSRSRSRVLPAAGDSSPAGPNPNGSESATPRAASVRFARHTTGFESSGPNSSQATAAAATAAGGPVLSPFATPPAGSLWLRRTDSKRPSVDGLGSGGGGHMSPQGSTPAGGMPDSPAGLFPRLLLLAGRSIRSPRTASPSQAGGPSPGGTGTGSFTGKSHAMSQREFRYDAGDEQQPGSFTNRSQHARPLSAARSRRESAISASSQRSSFGGELMLPKPPDVDLLEHEAKRLAAAQAAGGLVAEDPKPDPHGIHTPGIVLNAQGKLLEDPDEVAQQQKEEAAAAGAAAAARSSYSGAGAGSLAPASRPSSAGMSRPTSASRPSPPAPVRVSPPGPPQTSPQESSALTSPPGGSSLLALFNPPPLGGGNGSGSLPLSPISEVRTPTAATHRLSRMATNAGPRRSSAGSDGLDAGGANASSSSLGPRPGSALRPPVAPRRSSSSGGDSSIISGPSSQPAPMRAATMRTSPPSPLELSRQVSAVSPDLTRPVLFASARTSVDNARISGPGSSGSAAPSGSPTAFPMRTPARLAPMQAAASNAPAATVVAVRQVGLAAGRGPGGSRSGSAGSSPGRSVFVVQQPSGGNAGLQQVGSPRVPEQPTLVGMARGASRRMFASPEDEEQQQRGPLG